MVMLSINMELHLKETLPLLIYSHQVRLQCLLVVHGIFDDLPMTVLDLNGGVSRHPYFEGGEFVTPTGSWHFGVNASSQYPDEAAKFVKWLTVGAGSELWWSKDSYDFPAQVAFLDSFKTIDDFQEYPLAYLKTAADEASVNPVPRPVTPGYLEYEQILGNTFNDIRNGSDPKDALETAVTRIEFEMEKYKQ